MSDKPTIVTTATVEELAAALAKALNEAKRPDPATLYTRAQAARKMGRAFNTIDRMILQGRLRATSDGKYISQQAIDNYINAEK